MLRIKHARVAKLADAPDLGSGGEILRGSSPLPGIFSKRLDIQGDIALQKYDFSRVTARRKIASNFADKNTSVMGLAGTSSLPTGDVAILHRTGAIQPKPLVRQQTRDQAWSQMPR